MITVGEAYRLIVGMCHDAVSVQAYADVGKSYEEWRKDFRLVQAIACSFYMQKVGMGFKTSEAIDEVESLMPHIIREAKELLSPVEAQ